MPYYLWHCCHLPLKLSFAFLLFNAHIPFITCLSISMYFLALMPRVGSLLSITSCSRSCRLLRVAWMVRLLMAWGHTCSYSWAECHKSKGGKQQPQDLVRKSGFYSQKLHGLCKAPEEDPGTAGPAASRCCGDWADLGSQSSPQHPTPARLHLFITCTYLLPASQVGRGTTASHLLPLQGSGLPRAGPRPASASCRRLSAPPPPPEL